MTVYEVSPDFRHVSGLVLVGDDHHWLRNLLNRTCAPEELPILEVERSPCGYHIRDRNDLPLADIAHLDPGFLVLSSTAVAALEQCIGRFGVFLPLHCRDCGTQPYSLFHVTCQIDALDRAQSDLKLWPGGRICQIVRPAFLEERITDVPIFAQAGCPGYFYVTDAFRNIVLEHGLTGFEFRQVWPRPDDAEERQKFLAKRLRKKRRKANHG